MPRGVQAEAWVATTQRHADTLEGRTEESYVVRELPAKPTDRQSSRQPTGRKAAAGSLSTPAAACCSSNSPCFAVLKQPGGGPQEAAFARTRASALLTSLEAGAQTWQNVEAELESTCFAAIRELGPLACGSAEQHKRVSLVPTVLLSSNSVAAGDQAATYARLLEHLKTQHAYAVLLQPSHFTQGVGGVLSEVLHQLASSSAAGAEDIQALYQWYADETGTGAEHRALQQQQQAAATPAAPASAAAGSKSGRKLRERKPPALLPGQQLLGATFANKWRTNQQRQLVLLVRGAEQVPALAMADLLALLLQDYARFPATLVLGCCRPASLFLSCLPLSCRTRMAPHLYDLPSQDARLEALFMDVVCGRPPWLVPLSERPLLAILQHYEHQSASAASVMTALSLAHTLHHATQPLACLAQAALSATAARTAQAGPAGGQTVVLDSSSSEDDEGRSHDGNSSSSSDTDEGGSDDGGAGAHTGSAGAAAKRRGGIQQADAQATVQLLAAQLPDSVVLDAARDMQRDAGALAGSAPPAAVDGRGGVGEGRGSDHAPAGKAEHTSVAARKGAAHGAAAQRGKLSTAEAAQEVQAARDMVVREVVRAADAHVRWRLGLLMCHAVACATGAARDRPELRLPALYVAAASPAFNTLQPRARQSACQHVLSELCGGSGRHSIVKCLADEALLSALTDQLEELMAASQKWHPLPDVADLQSQLQQLCSGAEDNFALLQQQQQGVEAGTEDATARRSDLGTPPGKRTGTKGRLQQLGNEPGSSPMCISPAMHDHSQGAGKGAAGPHPLLSPTSAVRRGLAAAQLGTPPAKAQAGPSSQAAVVGGQEALAGPSTQPSVAAAGSAARGGALVNRRSRKQQLMQSIQESAAPATQAPQLQQQDEEQGAAGTAVPATRQGRLAAWLHTMLAQLLAVCPFTLPGSAALTFSDAAALEDAWLWPSPRGALHDALLHPSRYLGPHVLDDACPLSCDVEVAYQRLAGRDSVAVMAWFTDFCDVMAMDPKDYQPQHMQHDARQQPAPKAKGKRKPSRQQRQEEEGSSDEGDAEEGGRAAPAGGDPGAQQQRVLSWAARFSQAAAELQHMGVVRPNKRTKREQTMQVMFQPADLHLGY